jgi:cholera toxin transcriptional activator
MLEVSDHPRVYRFSVFEVDTRTGEFWKKGIKIRLQDQPLQVLTALLERPKELVTREELIKQIWPADTFVDFDHSLNTAVNKLREVLGDSAATPRFIETLPKRGYRFVGDVEVITPMEATPNQAAASTLAPATQELPTVSRLLIRTLFVLAQVMYLGFYVAALINMDEINFLLTLFFGSGAWVVSALVILTAMVGIPVRLFLLLAASFDYARLRTKYDLLFMALLVLDVLWGVSPILTAHHIGIGLALAISAALIYLPFGQRTLVHMAYRQ